MSGAAGIPTVHGGEEVKAAKPAPWKEEPKLQRWLEPRTPEKGGVQAPIHGRPDALEPMPLPLNAT